MATSPAMFAEHAHDIASQDRQRKQYFKDQEFEDKANDILANRKALVEKLPTLKGADHEQAFNALRQTDTDLRMLYHPDKNPGMLEKFGHLLTDHFGLTNSKDRIEREAAKRNAALEADARTAKGQAAAAAPSPEQQAVTGAQAQGAGQHEQVEQVVNNWKALNKDATPEEEAKFRKDLSESAFLGYKHTAASDRGNWELVQGMKNGQPFSYMHDKITNRNTTKEGADLGEGDLEGFIPVAKNTPKPSTSPFNETLAAYARSHNTTPDKLPFQAYQYVIATIAKLHAMPSSSTSTSLKQDVNGMWVPVTETNTRTPGGGKLVDPLGPASSNWMEPAQAPQPGAPQAGAPPDARSGTSEAQQITSTAPPSPHDLRKEASARNPSAPGGGHTNVGKPLFQGRTPFSDAAIKASDTAETAYKDLKAAAASGSPVDSQGIILSWLRGRVNRVTATEIDSVRNLGNLFQKFDGSASSVLNGTMTRQQMNWFVQSAKQNFDTAKQKADSYRNPGGSTPESTTGSGFDWGKAPVRH